MSLSAGSEILESTHNVAQFTVSEISTHIKMTLEDKFSYVRVRGEISGSKLAPSGHLYFSLKDSNAVISAVAWKGVASKFRGKLEDGMEVICTGSITAYGGQSKYQLIVQNVEPAGLGALMVMYEKLKAKLAAEGLFDESRKKKLPQMPRTIGIVTSETGAVIRDILHRISDRFPVRVIVWNVLVQGEKSAAQVAAAINGFNQLSENGSIPALDLLIVARGGGSYEDLWSFNEEIVVRAAANSKIALISAIGHETDFTLLDFVADHRAPTPTAAAEIAVPVRSELILNLMNLNRRLASDIVRLVEERGNSLISLVARLPNYNRILQDNSQKLDDISLRLGECLPRFLERKKLELDKLKLNPNILALRVTQGNKMLIMLTEKMQQNASKRLDDLTLKLKNIGILLESYHYKKVLERGFALVKDERGALVTSAKLIVKGQDYEIEFVDGTTKISGK